MGLTDTTSGYFGDVPYCSPVESSVFFDLIMSAKVHRVSETMMTKADSVDFFMSEKNTLRDLSLLMGTKSSERGSSSNTRDRFGVIDAIPPLFSTSFSAQRLLRDGKGGGCFVTIVSSEAQDVFDDLIPYTGDEPCTWNRVSLDLKGIDYMWQSFILFLLGDASQIGNVVYVLPRVDLYLGKNNPYGEFIFSVWALGVSSILHHFASFSVDSIKQRLGSVSILITVFPGSEGDCVADKLHLFFENRLRVCVHRVFEQKTSPTRTLSNDLARIVADGGREEWIEKMVETVVGIHEDLCDVDTCEKKELSSMLACILVIIPEIQSLRRDLERRLCDSYTSSPIVVVTRDDQIPLLLASDDRPVFVTFLCSPQNMGRQLLKSEHERCFSRLDAKALIYCGLNSWNYDAAMVHMLLPGCPAPVFFPPPKIELSGPVEQYTKENCVDCGFIQDATNIILWLFRRFRLDLGKGGVQPVLHIPEMLFVSREASALFDDVMRTMEVTGLVITMEQSDGSKCFSMEVLGRSLSYRFRLPYEPTLPEFTPYDVKCILWCHAFRKPKTTASRLISSAHLFPKWVEEAIDMFCFSHRISLEGAADTEGGDLVQYLSSIPKRDNIVSRVKAFLTYPSGERRPISRHVNSTSSTYCRGWFDQAPIAVNGVLSHRSHVNIYCYPSLNELCEIRFGDSVLQCPLDLSYPLIATHIILHTTLRNNGVFLEYAGDSSSGLLLPIPLVALQSPTLRSFLDDTGDAHVGFWIDSCMDSTLPVSDSLVLASLMTKASSLLGLCDRPAVCQKRIHEEPPMKKQKCEVTEPLKVPSEAEAATIKEFANAAIKLGREVAEKRFKGMRGFDFLNPLHKNYAYYIHVLKETTL